MTNEELDRLVAEKAMGWTCKTCGGSEILKSSGRYPQCLLCHRTRNREWARKNKDKRRPMTDEQRSKFKSYRKRWALRERYGISLEQYNEMMLRCGGCCEVCGVSDPKLHVDHCHSTGAVRGLLCHRCNFCIGFSGDSPDVLKSAAAYLQKSALKAVDHKC